MEQPNFPQIVPDKNPSIEILRLSAYFKFLSYGEVTIKIKNGKPVMVTSAYKDVKLTDS